MKDTGVCQKIVGQNFWHFLSGDEDLYIDIVEPIGYQARYHNEDFDLKKGAIETRLTQEFTSRFCAADFSIDWGKVVAFNSGNFVREARGS